MMILAEGNINKKSTFGLLVDSLGMSQAGIARYLDVGEMTVCRWMNGKVKPPMSAVIALESLLSHKDALEKAGFLCTHKRSK